MRFSDGFRTAAFILLLLLALLQIGSMLANILRQIDTLSDARADNQIWTLAQAEVDYRRLTTVLYSADAVDDLTEVRNRFDIFYSRIQTLQESDRYTSFLSRDGFREQFEAIRSYLDAALPYIDGSDTELFRDLPMLASFTRDVEDQVRQLALTGLNDAAIQTQSIRDETRTLLRQLASATMLLIIGLLMVLFVTRIYYRETREASKAIRISRARIATMIETALDGILVTDPDGFLLESNRAAQTMFGLEDAVDDLLHLSGLIRNPEGPESYNNPAASGLVGQGRKLATGLRLDGTEFAAEVSLMQTTTEAQDDIFVAYVRDITARLKAEADLLQARDQAEEGERTKANLLAVMSHEIRTPLNGVIGAADLLEATPLTDKQASYVAAMRTSGDVLMRHINDVLEMSRLDAGSELREPQPLNLRKIVTDTVDSQRAVASRLNTTLKVQVAEDVPHLVAGELQGLQQCLLNLISNAIKFAPSGQVSAEVDLFGKDDLIEFRVSDDGMGIPEDELPKVFDDFFAGDASFARQRQGTGLGLGITQRIVRAMGGEIGAESILGEGSLFWFRVPLPEVSTSQKEMPLRPLPADHMQSFNILLVEDNEINRMITGDMLRNAGHQVTEATDGAQGVATAEAKKFDLILMDISMPGMDGITAARTIRDGKGASQESVIIALTAQVLPPDADEITQAGIQDVLHKPVSSQALIAAITGAVQRADSTTQEPEARPAGRLDPAVLKDVVDNIGLSDLRQHHQEFARDIAPLLESLTSPSTLTENDRSLAHKLSGAAAVLGMCQMHEALARLENTLSDPNSAMDAALAHEIADIWQDTETEFLTFLSDSVPKTP
ncbi:hybrid sensor histidine kinase/response regulator [Cognatishimia maritima]|uniref:histidine kinase n=1 Tax=Cognatishimia maritima TaxID=870908 RepID=A0A1M5L5U3_9RHOB|nr:response regulator [Cognatishimia maritima]SHG59783.1 PAS domain S-box-containing protein [Cognatishimia maritima]